MLVKILVANFLKADGLFLSFQLKLWLLVFGRVTFQNRRNVVWLLKTKYNQTTRYQMAWQTIQSARRMLLLLSKIEQYDWKLDSVKKLIKIVPSWGLSIYGKVTVMKSLSIPKFVCTASLLPTFKDAIKELNLLLFRFLWKGVDRATSLSVINEYEKGGLTMVDLGTIITS